MMVWRMLVSRLAPLLACLGLLGIWQVGALTLNTESFPTAFEALRAVPAILGDKGFPDKHFSLRSAAWRSRSALRLLSPFRSG